MALIKTIEEFQKWVGVNESTSLEAVMGDILLVEDEVIVKYLGRNFYEEYEEKYQAGGLNDLENKLLDKLQLAISNLAQESYLDLNQVQISDGGIHINSSETRKTAFQWQINNLRRGFLRKGYNGLERALNLLEDNIDAEEFATWSESPVATVFQQYFINTAQEFSKYYNIYDSRLTYLALLPILKKEERFLIEPVLGAGLFEEIKEQIKDRDLSPENKILLEEFIRPALAHLVVAHALAEEGFRLTPDGIELTFGRFDELNKEKASESASQLNRKIRNAHQDGQAYLVKLRNYLNEKSSVTTYHSYFISSLYQFPGSAQNVVIRNTDPTAKTYRFF
ncbi:hypothetical protein AHMF7605_10480 [Adhaeribacter arboris]|uniref:Uncharacterized protein n=1 Tax=Adhaeribacter arboris TaxID=2072846 RepID=A0A2T2YEK0_9BACT|nr:DUF6712 family protein [Adhaeribacter arboris]PSR53913.1 hypothetical protein AHMF7605_10480 [Adhaeribacter arboris]